jgi:hypothetical protein
MQHQGSHQGTLPTQETLPTSVALIPHADISDNLPITTHLMTHHNPTLCHRDRLSQLMVVKVVLLPPLIVPPLAASDTWRLPGPPISMGDPPVCVAPCTPVPLRRSAYCGSDQSPWPSVCGGGGAGGEAKGWGGSFFSARRSAYCGSDQSPWPSEGRG